MLGKPNIEKSEDKKSRLKLFLYGNYGVGKTCFALKFPKPIVIDTQRGTVQYDKDFKFDSVYTSDPDEVYDVVKWLNEQKHQYQTLIIDPITVYWEALQDKWQKIFLKRKVGTPGFKVEFYDMNPGDWLPLKNDYRRLMRILGNIDMNVVLTAQEKNKYEGFMTKDQKIIGKTFDGEKGLPYLFDYVLWLAIEENEKRWAYSTKKLGGKQRGLTKKIPDKFCIDLNAPTFDFFKNFDMFRDSIPQQTEEVQAAAIETEKDKAPQPSQAVGAAPESPDQEPVKITQTVEFPQRAVKKATKKQQKEIQEAVKDYSGSAIQQSLKQYGADSIEGLSSENAADILNKIKNNKKGGKK